MLFEKVKHSSILKFLDQSPMIISYHDNKTKTIYSNETYSQFFSQQILKSEDSRALNRLIDNIAKTKIKISHFSFKNQFSEQVNLEISIFFDVEDVEASSNEEGFFITYKDITNHTNDISMQQKLIENSRIVALGQMAGGIAHEINNPLSVIFMNGTFIQSMIIEEKFESAKLTKFINTILSTTTRIEKIVSGLQYFAQERPNEPFTTEKLSVIIDDTLGYCLEKFKFKKISFCYQKISPLFELNCRPVQVTQVLLNLLNNAADAAEGSETKWISLMVHDLGELIELKVIDSGPGISKENLKKIMDPFFSTKPVGKGTGLGLSISKGIIENHHGTLVYDHEAKNTTFVITLPKYLPIN